VSFQDVEKTNILLKKAGIADKLDEMTKMKLQKHLVLMQLLVVF
jgi:hypothetical protein